MTSTALVARVLWLRRRLRARERWTPVQVAAHQARALGVLRAHAMDGSPFYRRLHRGLEDAPLTALPPVSKAALMDAFDEVVTDRSLRLADLQAYLEADQADGRGDGQLFAGRYWVAATSGSSGRRSVIPTDIDEWTAVIASYARAGEWAGVRARLRHRTRMAVVSSTTTWHQSSRVAASIRSPLVDSTRLDAADPLPGIVARLNQLQPEVLVGYASMVRVLAEEQLAGRLTIAPRAVNSASEVLTPAARELATRAWGVAPFDVYAATETGGIAAECGHHAGLHLFEDLVVAEPVDDDYAPVAAGVAGSRLLVTVLSSRTLPLIRFELTDRVRLSTAVCPCGLPFRLVSGVDGRTDDVLTLPAAGGGTVAVHPVAFHQVFDLLDAAGWQVRQDEDGGLTVLLAAPGAGVDPTRLQADVVGAVAAAGATATAVRVQVVDTIPVGAAGKRPLVVARSAHRVDTGPPSG
ncbi:phenylacetate--CoA ligase family protein [Geodermatophilus sp. SYSU D00684]